MTRIHSVVTAVSLALLLANLPGCGGGGSSEGGGEGRYSLRINTSRAEVPANADWVAVQDGDGAWTRLQPSATGQYTVDLTSPTGRYGIALVAVESGKPVVRILQMTRADGLEWDLPAGDPVYTTITLGANGVPANGSWSGCMRGKEGTGTGNSQAVLNDVPMGTRDLLAALYPQGDSNPPSKLLTLRNQFVNGPDRIAVDFNSIDAVAPELYTIQAPGGQLVTTMLHTSNGAALQTCAAKPPGKYAALPPNRRAAGDLYVATGIEEVAPNKLRLAAQTFRTPADKSLTLPAQFGPADVAANAGTGPLAMTATWSRYNGASLYEMVLKKGANRSRALSDRDWLVYVSPGWLDAKSRAANLQYETPLLQTAAAWDPAWSLNRTSTIDWRVGAYSTNVALRELLAGLDNGFMIPLADGATLNYSIVVRPSN